VNRDDGPDQSLGDPIEVVDEPVVVLTVGEEPELDDDRPTGTGPCGGLERVVARQVGGAVGRAVAARVADGVVRGTPEVPESLAGGGVGRSSRKPKVQPRALASRPPSQWKATNTSIAGYEGGSATILIGV
jgi:hypothetical protein